MPIIELRAIIRRIITDASITRTGVFCSVFPPITAVNKIMMLFSVAEGWTQKHNNNKILSWQVLRQMVRKCHESSLKFRYAKRSFTEEPFD